MKRAASNSASVQEAKKAKLEDYDPFDQPGLRRFPRDIYENGLVDDSGYIPCSCFMTWKPTKKHKAILQAVGKGSQMDRFEVEFSGDCTDFFHEIELKARDDLLLALKGATAEIPSDTSRSCNLNLKLIYQKGVIVRFVKHGDGSRTVNTWQLNQNRNINEDSWFLTPKGSRSLSIFKTAQHPLQPDHATLPSLQAFISEPLDTKDVKPTTPSSTIVENKIAEMTSMNESRIAEAGQHSAIQGTKLSKTQKKLLRQQERRKRLASEHLNPVRQDTAVDTTVSKNPQPPATTPSNVYDISQGEPNTAVASEFGLAPTSPSAETTHFTAGLVADYMRYHPLKNDLPANTLCSAIGIVVQISMPLKTRTEELMCNVKLVDPSNTPIDDLSGSNYFQINCFAKKYEQWLPSPSTGEILVVQDMKISHYRDSPMGIGYSEKMKWAIYSPTTGQISHGDRGSAPESEVLANGFGYEYSPFLYPGEAVISYCRKLADWWREVEKKRNVTVNAHQVIAADSSFPRYGRPQRQHRNISEAGPDVPPDGYFDCTVEILHGYMNDNGVYNLYVTDYTLNTAITPVESSWCPPDLGDYVLKIAAWDAASQLAPTMLAGQYYNIRNARILLSGNGYIEGKLVETKIRRLIEGVNTEDVHFKALLERKKIWQDKHSADDRPNQFEYSPINEAIERKHFNCVVEVLHVIPDVDIPCIYVTDYTSRKELLSTKTQGGWSRGLEGRILRIALFENQVEMARSIQTGLFYTIKKLRVKSSTTSCHFQGQLGGSERLIFQHNPKTSDDKLDELKRRKEEWKRGLEPHKLPPEIRTELSTPKHGLEPRGTPAEIKAEPGTPKIMPKNNRRFKTIAELKEETKCPSKSRIRARVLDFHPWDLREAVIVHCTNCKQDLSTFQKACFKCHDTNHEYVRYMYQLYLLLEDEGGTQLHVSLHDGSSVFKDLERRDIREDLKAYLALNDRLVKMFGNLLETHKRPSPKDGSSIVASDSPMVSMIIDCWEVDGKRSYCLADCEDLNLA